jgi:hypothetical protein
MSQLTEDIKHDAHAKFSPSQLKYLHKCAGYHGKDTTSPAAEMGTRIHAALEVRDPSALLSDKEIEIYDKCVAEEDNLFNSAFGGIDAVTIVREERLVIEIDATTAMFGTADVVAHQGDTALCVDYKTGISAIDEPNDNWQAKAYALGIFQKYPAVNVVHFAFIIPQRGETPVGSLNRTEHMKTLRDDVSAVVVAAESTRPKWDDGTMTAEMLNPSVNCRFCRHEGNCPALTALCIEVAQRYKPDMLPAGSLHITDVDDPNSIAKMFIVAKIVGEWAEHVKFRAVSLAKEGVEFEGLALRSLGSRISVVDSSIVLQISMDRGLEVFDVLEASNISVSQLASKLASTAPRGTKATVEREFVEDLISSGAIRKGEVNYTLTIKS